METERNKKVMHFKDLEVWHLGKEIALLIYKLTARFPKEELYGLTSQMRRAAISVSSNIAEGFNRFHNREYRRFLLLSLGSCAELETQLEISFSLNYIQKEQTEMLLDKLNHETRMLRKLIKKLKERFALSKEGRTS